MSCISRAAATSSVPESTVQKQDKADEHKPAAKAPRAGIPTELQWLVEFILENGLDKVSVLLQLLQDVCQCTAVHTCVQVTIVYIHIMS